MTDASDTTFTTLDELGQLVDAITVPFACSGVASSTAAPRVRFRGGAVISFGAGRPSPLDLEVVDAHLTAAPFGHGRRTMVDPGIRKARQIAARGGAWSVDGFDPLKSGVLAAVREGLRLDPTRAWSAELESLQVYPPGGHFGSHKDTPHGAGHVATLVVCLPWPFAGGRLELRHEDRTVEVDFANELARDVGSHQVAWAAFFTDVDHRIHTVTEGHRVTLTYRVTAGEVARRAKKTKEPAARDDGETLRRLLAAAAVDPACFRMGALVRIPCAHLYRAEVDSAQRLPLTRESAAALKGRDAVVALAAIDAGVAATLVHCLVASDDSGVLESWALPRYPTKSDVARWCGQLGARDGDAEPTLDIEEEDQDRHFIGSPEAFRRLFQGVYSASGYYGNEASEAEFYVTAVLELAFERYRAAEGRGRRVRHAKFGPGIVTGRPPGSTDKVRVRFDDGEERTLLESFLRDAE